MGSLTAPWPKPPQLLQEGLMADGHRGRGASDSHCSLTCPWYVQQRT